MHVTNRGDWSSNQAHSLTQTNSGTDRVLYSIRVEKPQVHNGGRYFLILCSRVTTKGLNHFLCPQAPKEPYFCSRLVIETTEISTKKLPKSTNSWIFCFFNRCCSLKPLSDVNKCVYWARQWNVKEAHSQMLQQFSVNRWLCEQTTRTGANANGS